jgi:spore coat protein U-like protein
MKKWSNTVLSVLSIAVISLLALGLTSTPAFAGTLTTTLNVTASVVTACSISGGTLAFGTYTGAEIDQTATLTVICTSQGPYSIGLSKGLGNGASTSNRWMTGATHNEPLYYALYLNAYHGTNWDDYNGTNVYSGNGTGSSQTIPVYGVLAANTPLVTDTYSDTITVTITY